MLRWFRMPLWASGAALAAGLWAQSHVPASTPTPEESAKAELGRYLFYDQRMSGNGTESCASCHRQDLAFTDGKAQAVGSTGELHPRGAMTLVNVADNKHFNWADPKTKSLEEQARTPMFGKTPVELAYPEDQFLALANTDPTYTALFRKAYPREYNPYSTDNVTRALAAFERTIVSRNSPYDRFHFGGDLHAISESAKRGEIIFFLDGGPSCFRCHGGVDFRTDPEIKNEAGDTTFHNTGLYNLKGLFSYPAPNRGLYERTEVPADVGKFAAPTLRNIAVTAPYMHDGSIATLEDVIDHYAAGGRTIHDGPMAGIGKDNPNKDPLVRGFQMTPRNRTDLVAFLKSLTDESLLHDPRFSNPWMH